MELQMELQTATRFLTVSSDDGDGDPPGQNRLIKGKKCSSQLMAADDAAAVHTDTACTLDPTDGLTCPASTTDSHTRVLPEDNRNLYNNLVVADNAHRLPYNLELFCG